MTLILDTFIETRLIVSLFYLGGLEVKREPVTPISGKQKSLTFEVHGVHEHEHNVMRNIRQEMGDVTVGGICHPLVDLLGRGQREGHRPVPEKKRNVLALTL